MGPPLQFHFELIVTFHRNRRSFLPFYYRLMGAKIGKGVILSLLTNIKEYDLVTIGDECVLDAGTISPFGLVSGGFELKPISFGARVIMGPKSIAVPGASIPDDSYIGHRSSSYGLGKLEKYGSTGRTPN
jgi:acetyltransferase-like isoleucine patch superfamily enzyme